MRAISDLEKNKNEVWLNQMCSFVLKSEVSVWTHGFIYINIYLYIYINQYKFLCVIGIYEEASKNIYSNFLSMAG